MDVIRRDLLYTAAFIYIDYKIQSRTLNQITLELRKIQTTVINGETVSS